MYCVSSNDVQLNLSRSKIQAMERGLEQWQIMAMAELTYRGLKYTQTKSDKGAQELHLQYSGYEIMSKRIHEAMKAEMD